MPEDGGQKAIGKGQSAWREYQIIYPSFNAMLDLSLNALLFAL